MPRPFDQSRRDFLDAEVERMYLHGFTRQQIATDLGVSRTYVGRLLAPIREAHIAGQYDQVLERMAAQGISNLPTKEAAQIGYRRQAKPFTDQERSIRTAYQCGTPIASIARAAKMSPQRVRYVLAKNPDLLCAKSDV